MTVADTPTATVDPAYSAALYSIWSMQDSLLQNYRTMFITTESLLMAVSAAIAASSTSSQHKFSWLLIIVGLLLWVVWLIVTQSRARDVHFIQELLKHSEEGRYINAPFTAFKNYQKAWLKNGAYTVVYVGNVHEPFIPRPVWPPTDVPVWRFWRWSTRIHMEVTLPGAYFLGWLVVAIYACWP